MVFKTKSIVGAYLVFFLLCSPVFANTPTLGTITPSSGSSHVDIAQAFTTTYADSSGWQHLWTVNFLVNTQVSGANCFSGLYNQNSNQLFLRDDSGTAWLGGYAPGSANIIENSYAKLDCSQTTVSGNGTTLTVNWRVTFKAQFTGAKNTYLLATDDANANSGVVQKGTWTIKPAPTVGTITPSSGTGQVGIPQTFTGTYSDSDGWQTLLYVNLLVNTTAYSGANCFSSYYDRSLNQLFMRDDSGTVWLGGYAPGSANVIENSYASLDCSQTTVSGNGTTMTVNWRVTFKSPFTGTKNTYLRATEVSGSTSGTIQKGTWAIPNNAPTVGTVTPSAGAAHVTIPLTFTSTHSDPDGWQNIWYVNFLVNTQVSGANCLSAIYERTTNLLFIRDDSGAVWLGGYTPGSANVIENSYVSLDCSQTTVSNNGTTITVNWRVTFKSPLAGSKNIYLGTTDIPNTSSGLIQKGTVTVNILPTVDTVVPSSGTGQVDVLQTFTATYSDADGWQDLLYTNFLVNTLVSGANCLSVYYDQNSDQLFMRNDSGTAWLGGYAPGSANVIENSYAKIDCSQTTASGNGTTMTVNWRVTFKSPFTGSKNTYLGATDDTGYYTGAFQKGTWTIQADTTPPQVAITEPLDGAVFTDP